MQNTMGFSAILRRRISRSGAAIVSRFSRRAADAHSDNSLSKLAAANRMMSSSGVSSSKSASTVPWVKLSGGDYCRFYCVAKKEAYTFSPSCYDEIVGSSHGWISFYDDQRNHHLSLSDPITERVIDLPPADTVVHGMVLGEDGRLAFITLGDSSSSRLSFFSRRRRYEWIPLLNPSAAEKKKKRVYEGVVHSSRHNRLFCITSDGDDDENSKLELECWDLREGEDTDIDDQLESPKLEQVVELDLDSPLQKETTKKKLKYLVCAEHTGEMYVVVRHVIDNTGRDISTYNVFGKYVTLGMDVYKIEREVGKARAVRMEDSLEGMAMFVGNNQGLALPAAEHSGLNPNCVYFTCDKRLPPRRNRWPSEKMGGIFDYRKREILPLSTYSFDNYARDHHAFWFTPRPHLF